MDRWDVLILMGAGYVGVMVLVRLMAVRRNQLVDQVRRQLEGQHAKKSKQLKKRLRLKIVTWRKILSGCAHIHLDY
ncbi:MAG: hypothetical protein MKZ95_10900 [Pirellulales bacterium]|nr:hypothetical protein [Pirellulales bacterium]